MSTGVGMGKCCLSGKLQSGTPKGRVETIGGLQSYVAEPPSKSSAKTVIFITDIFGFNFPNVRLLADNYAAAGFTVYIPDLHQGDSLPISFLQNVEPPLKDQESLTLTDKAKNAALVPATLGPWMIKHREAVTAPLLDGFINTVRLLPGTNKIGALGFCWGGRYAILQARGPSLSASEPKIGGVDAVVACHPSMVAVPGDFENVKVPLSVAVGSRDSLVDAKTVEGIKEELAKRPEVKSEVRVYEDQVHGFSLRGDWSSEKDKEAMDQVEKQGIEWFQRYLS